MDVLDHLDFRHRNQSLVHNLIEKRNELLDLFFRIDHADHHRGQAQDFGRKG